MASLKKRFSQLHSIYVFSDNKQSKSKEIFTQMESLGNVLKNEVRQLVEYCRPQYEKNETELKIMDEFKYNYRKYTPIGWYTQESFIYHMLNRALRTFDIETLIKMKFFIQDLHEQIKHRHSQLTRAEKPSVVYRGQGMFKAEFENLRKKPSRSLLSFNVFLSTSTKEEIE